MEITRIDCERFFSGSQEIDRKRLIIALVLSTVEHMAWTIKRKSHGWKSGQRILSIAFGELEFVWEADDNSVCGRFYHKRQYTRWWGYSGEVIPASLVSTIYEHLSEIVEKTAEAFPRLGIIEHFQFFMNQAPAKSV
ncbi:MAG: hypothetical protein WCT08_02635 [Patescibacteria group bacterium]|jgi:hypothetical protein